jgi:hypothetical protein
LHVSSALDVKMHVKAYSFSLKQGFSKEALPLHRELLDVAPQLRQWCQAQLTHQFLRRHPHSLGEGRVREL